MLSAVKDRIGYYGRPNTVFLKSAKRSAAAWERQDVMLSKFETFKVSSRMTLIL